MKGYWTDNYYMGYMPDGRYHAFENETDYKEAYEEALEEGS